MIIIGGGLAGCEAAYQCAKRGVKVKLFEAKPYYISPAHKTEYLAELVCSNSLKSDEPTNGHGLLKAELRRLDSLLLRCAEKTKIPGGKALVVDRDLFALEVTKELAQLSNVEIQREEIKKLPEAGIVIIATGPLTSESLSQVLADFCGEENLFFYDAISPIIQAQSINYGRTFFSSRYQKGDDYLNCPFTKEEYENFYQQLVAGEVFPFRDFEPERFFEGCLPIEELARRGKETLIYGPMKPVGLKDPRTGKMPYAVVQLRKENQEGTMYNLVGFQTRLRYREQERIFRLIPGLERAEFLRYGSIHRNTYINGPKILQPTLQTIKRETLFIAGQLCGVEGYVESIATGLWAGINAVLLLLGEKPVIPPRETIIGGLIQYITTPNKDFQPMNANFGLVPRIKGSVKACKQAYYHRSMQALNQFLRVYKILNQRV